MCHLLKCRSKGILDHWWSSTLPFFPFFFYVQQCFFGMGLRKSLTLGVYSNRLCSYWYYILSCILQCNCVPWTCSAIILQCNCVPVVLSIILQCNCVPLVQSIFLQCSNDHLQIVKILPWHKYSLVITECETVEACALQTWPNLAVICQKYGLDNVLTHDSEINRSVKT